MLHDASLTPHFTETEMKVSDWGMHAGWKQIPVCAYFLESGIKIENPRPSHAPERPEVKCQNDRLPGLWWNSEPARGSFHGSLPCCRGATAANALQFRSVRPSASPWTRVTRAPFVPRMRAPPLGVPDESQWGRPGDCDPGGACAHRWRGTDISSEASWIKVEKRQKMESRATPVILFSVQYRWYTRENTSLRRFHLSDSLQDDSLSSDSPRWSGVKMRRRRDGNNQKSSSSSRTETAAKLHPPDLIVFGISFCFTSNDERWATACSTGCSLPGPSFKLITHHIFGIRASRLSPEVQTNTSCQSYSMIRVRKWDVRTVNICIFTCVTRWFHVRQLAFLQLCSSSGVDRWAGSARGRFLASDVVSLMFVQPPK